MVNVNFTTFVFATAVSLLQGVLLVGNPLYQLRCVTKRYSLFYYFSGFWIYVLKLQGSEETVRVIALDRSFHVECYKCEVSSTPRVVCVCGGQMHLCNTVTYRP